MWEASGEALVILRPAAAKRKEAKTNILEPKVGIGGRER
jgi:hypothetical protein